jgi:hypothetical protein
MTQKTLSSIIVLMIFSLTSSIAFAGGHTAKAQSATGQNEVKSQPASDHPTADNKMPVFPAPLPKVPHGKVQAPHMEELPHVHKFHKERVKKIKKHHSKFWLLSKIILVLCHLSILVIAFLHAIH